MDQNAPGASPEASATAPATAETKPPLPTPQEALESLRRLFDTLVPPSTIDITDGFGGTHRLRGMLVADAQVQVMRQLDALLEVELPPGMLQQLQGSEWGAMLSMALRVATDDHVLEGLSNAFATAHPKAVKAAIANARAEDVDLPADPKPRHLFPIEEIVAGLAPFLMRLVKRLMGTMAAALPVAPSR